MKKPKADWKKRCEDLLKDNIENYGFGDSVLHHIKLTTFGIEKKQCWATVFRDNLYWEYNCDTWEELHQELFMLIQGIIIAEGSYPKWRKLRKEELQKEGVGIDEACRNVKERIKNGDY